jgi:SnoaL-like polyketide cyclase
MSTEDNKAIVQRFFEEVFNEKRVDRADEFVAPDYLDHAAVPGQGPGLEGAKQQRWAMYFAAIPDMHATIDAPLGRGGQAHGALHRRGHASRGSCWASRPPGSASGSAASASTA